MIFNAAGNQVAGPVVPAGGIDTAVALAAAPLTPANPFTAWVGAFVAAGAGGVAPLTAARTALRGTIAGWVRTDAIAASIVQRGLDELAAQVPPMAINAQAALVNLSRRSWWQLFVDWSQRAGGPLTFDYQESPGYYHAMMRAFDQVLVAGAAHNNPATFLNAFAWYDQLHQDVTGGVLHLTAPGVWALVGNTLSGGGGPTSYGIQHRPDPIAFYELRGEGVLELVGVPGAFTCRYDPVSRRIRTTYAAAGVGALVNPAFAAYRAARAGTTAATTALQQAAASYVALSGQVQTAAGQLGLLGEVGDPVALEITGKLSRKTLDRAEQLQVRAARQRVRHIAKLVRALHVGHYYTDANGRLNTMLLLNWLLLSEGLSPVIMEDTSLFGGSQSLDTLAQQIVEGGERFQGAVPRQ